MSEQITHAQLQRYFPVQRMNRYILTLPEHRVVYVKNPKAGCSTVTSWLHRVHTGDHEKTFENVHREHRVPRIGDDNRREVLGLLSGEGYRFAFVRHPAKRFESAYRDKMVDNPRWRPKITPALGIEVGPDETVPFEQFLEAVEQQDPVAGMNPHWRPQHVNLLHPTVTYDRVGRLESFEADLRLVSEESGMPWAPYEHRNAGGHRESVYDGRPDLRRRVEELFATDMELYGY